MITATHAIVYADDPDQARAFFRDVLEMPNVDIHGGWLIFALPPAEMAVHPAEENDRHELFFMCTDLQAEMVALGQKGVQLSDVEEARWGSIVKIQLPGGGEVGLYQPRHPTALVIPSN